MFMRFIQKHLLSIRVCCLCCVVLFSLANGQEIQREISRWQL